MAQGMKTRLALAAAMSLALGAALADPPRDHRGGPHEAPHPAEPHPGPSGYQRINEPEGWNKRPATFDRATYQHNYQAARKFKIGAYRRPPGFVARHWGYGDRLPHAYWAPQYILADYWLFALEVPPSGYEWVRVDGDALMIDINTGEVLQTEYGAFD